MCLTCSRNVLRLMQLQAYCNTNVGLWFSPNFLRCVYIMNVSKVSLSLLFLTEFLFPSLVILREVIFHRQSVICLYLCPVRKNYQEIGDYIKRMNSFILCFPEKIQEHSSNGHIYKTLPPKTQEMLQKNGQEKKNVRTRKSGSLL